MDRAKQIADNLVNLYGDEAVSVEKVNNKSYMISKGGNEVLMTSIGDIVNLHCIASSGVFRKNAALELDFSMGDLDFLTGMAFGFASLILTRP